MPKINYPEELDRPIEKKAQLRAEINADVEAFLANGGKIQIFDSSLRLADDSKPAGTLNTKKMTERENRERMKRQACAYYRGGKQL